MELKVLNSMEIVNFDIQGDCIVYISVADNKENRERLNSIGISKEDIEIWKHEGEIDLTYITTQFWNFWSKETGFELRSLYSKN